MGAVSEALRSAAEAAGARIHTDATVERILVDESDRTAAGVLVDDGRELRARVVLSNADPVRTAALAGLPAPQGWRQDGPVVKVMVLLDGLPDFPAWPGPEPWQGTIDIGFTMRGARRRRGRRPRRAARPAAVDRGRVPDRGRPRPRAAGAPRALAVLPVLSRPTPTPRRRPTSRSRASPRPARGCPTASWTASRSGPRELEARFGLTGGHIFHGEMLARQLLERRLAPRRFGGVEGLYLAGSGAHPGGAVTGAPGYLAARAVLEDRGGGRAAFYP